ncbi:hypothetical protein QTP86_003863 [Hemibagrus guttatus]|nr:hypothetical protein QTP86_003863 [Hemibagrus guttatus]
MCVCALDRVLAQIRYAVLEEREHGAFVGNIAEDLGLDVARLSARRFRIVSGARKQYLEVVIENPVELYRVEVEILDTRNDGSKFAELVLESPLDREKQKMHEMVLTAVDGGSPLRSGTAQIMVTVLDANDNVPVFDKSVYRGIVDYEKASVYELYVQAKDKGPSAVAEDAPPGTVIAVISVMDRDSGENGAVDCQIPSHVPFRLHSSFKNYYTLATSEFLDRESVGEYNITLTARDLGSPSLSTGKTIHVLVSDVNDNPPRFLLPSYTVYVTENNAPGASICSVSAVDPDSNQNAYLSYSILEGQIRGMPVSTYVSINSDNGNIYALRSFDYEQLRNFQIRVQARDAGFPPLSGNVTVSVFVLDQNDNAPLVVSPLPKNGTAATETVPRSADTGYLVAKITALDADSGQNSRLSYQVLHATDPGLFSIALYTGEIRTIRRFVDKDATRHRLVILVKDNGQPSLSATVSLILTLVDGVPESLSDLDEHALSRRVPSNLALYLIVSLSLVSLIFLVAIIVLATLKCYKDRDCPRGFGLSSIGAACCTLESEPPAEACKKSNLNMQISTGTKVPTNCVDSTGTTAQNYCYKVCLTPESAKSDFMFMKSYSPSTPRNNAAKEAENLAWSSQSRGSSANNGATTPNELKQDNTNWALTKNQTSTLKSYNSVNMDGTLMRKVMQTDSENYVNPVAAGQYWTWGTRMRECKMPSPATGLPERAWAPRHTPTKNPQQQQPSGQSHGHPPPDYHHNVYIPGTPSALCTLRPSNRSELDVHNTFSTFGKKRKFISPSIYDPRDETGTEVINNDLYNE